MTDSPAQTGLTRSVGRNTLIQFVGKAIGTILGVVTAALVLRYLQVNGYGQYTAAMAYVGFFSVVADLGLYLILIRELNKPDVNEQKVIGNLLAIRWTSALIILAASAAAIWVVPAYSPAVRMAVTIATVSFVAVAGTQLLVALFQTKMNMVPVTTAELLGRVVLLGGTVAAIRLDGGLFAVMWSVVIGSLVNFLFVWAAARRYVLLRLEFDWTYWKIIIIDTLPVSASIVLNLIYFKADTILLSLFHKGDYAIGLYGAAYKVLEILITFPSIFVGLLLPALGQAFSAQQKERFVEVFQKGFNVLLMMAAPILTGGWFLAEAILVGLGKQEYGPGAPVLRLLLIALVASFLNSLSGHTITIINRQRQMVWGYLSVAIIGLIVYVSLIPRFSYYGAATGTIATEVLAAIIGYVLVLRVMRFRLEIAVTAKILVACLVMWGMMVVTRPLNIWAAGIAGLAAYIAVIFLTRALPWSAVKEIVARTPAPALREP